MEHQHMVKSKKNAKSLHPNTQAEKVVDYADTMSAESLHYADTMLVLPLTTRTWCQLSP